MSKNKSKKDNKKGQSAQQPIVMNEHAHPMAPASELQVLNSGYQNQQQPPPLLMMPPPQPVGKNGNAGLASNIMSGIVGGGAGAIEDQRGLLDNDEYQPPGQNQPRERVRGNQDLWLLNLFFKGCSLLVYFLLPIVFPKALSYIVVLMLNSIDFWVVKNIVGRKLVKMRWWFIIDDQGNERWHYESKDHPILFQDKLVFWGSLYLYPAVWLLFCVMNAITLQIFETATTFVCALIGAVQWWGFKNCKNAHERKVKIMRRRREGRGATRRGPPNGNPLQENLLPPQGRMPMPPPNQQQYRQ